MGVLLVGFLDIMRVSEPCGGVGFVSVWHSGNIVGHINEVTLRRAGLVLRWVTVRGYTILVSNQATQAHSAWPSLRG